MDSERYKNIQEYCFKKVQKSLHSRHLEDVVQYVAMKDFEYGGHRSWRFLIIDYLRFVGVTEKDFRAGAKMLEYSLIRPFNDNINHSKKDKKISRYDIIEQLLKGLNLNSEVLEWIAKHYKIKKIYM